MSYLCLWLPGKDMQRHWPTSLWVRWTNKRKTSSRNSHWSRVSLTLLPNFYSNLIIPYPLSRPRNSRWCRWGICTSASPIDPPFLSYLPFFSFLFFFYFYFSILCEIMWIRYTVVKLALRLEDTARFAAFLAASNLLSKHAGLFRLSLMQVILLFRLLLMQPFYCQFFLSLISVNYLFSRTGLCYGVPCLERRLCTH